MGELRSVCCERVLIEMVENCHVLTHWGWVMHICISGLTVIGSDNGLAPWTVPNHYLKQCWNNGNWTLKKKLQWNFNWNSNIFIQENVFELVICKMAAILSRGRIVKCSTVYTTILCSRFAWISSGSCRLVPTGSSLWTFIPVNPGCLLACTMEMYTYGTTSHRWGCKRYIDGLSYVYTRRGATSIINTTG